MKHVSAILAAFLITVIIGLGIMVIGVSAIANTNTVPLQNSPGSGSLGGLALNTSVDPGGSPASTSSQVQQLQQQVMSLQSQLNQAGQEIQQYQALILALQQSGVIAIDRNGNVTLNRSGLFDDH